MNRIERYLIPIATVAVLTSGFVLNPTTVGAQTVETGISASVEVAAGSKVALLPVVNISGEKDAKQRTDQSRKAEEELAKQFEERGFSVLPREIIDRALTDEKIDLTDEEYYNRASVLRIGKAAGADVVVFVLITDVDQRRVRAPLTGEEMVGKARTKMWVLNVAAEKPILNAVRQESQARSNLAPGFDSGARLIRNSVAGAVRDSLKPFLQGYPARKK